MTSFPAQANPQVTLSHCDIRLVVVEEKVGQAAVVGQHSVVGHCEIWCSAVIEKQACVQSEGQLRIQPGGRLRMQSGDDRLR